MSELKHSPAPFTATVDLKSGAIGIQSDNKLVATVWHSDSLSEFPGSEEAAANSKLFKAAPDMLEALIDSNRELGEWITDNEGDPDDNIAFCEGRRAITKATT